MLMTASGHAVAIEDLELGDFVQAKDVASGAEGWKQTTALLSSNLRRLYTLSVIGATGAVERIEVTDNHPFHVPGQGWIQTLDLTPGMAIETAGGGTATVKFIADSGRDAKTYNLEVAGYHTYYAYAGETALLVHNACGKPLLGRNAKYTKQRTNTDLNGVNDRAVAKSIFRNQTKGQKVQQIRNSDNGAIIRRAANGVKIRMNANGNTRLDLPGRGTRPNGETIHLNK